MVSPPVCVPLPMVEEAVEMNPAKVESPVTLRVDTSESVPALSVPKLPVFPFTVVDVAVPKDPIPLAVKLVVLAPPFIEKRLEVMVEDAVERKPVESNVLVAVPPK